MSAARCSSPTAVPPPPRPARLDGACRAADGAAGQYRIDGKAHFEADKGPNQRDQVTQQRSIRQEPFEISKVERPDAEHDPRLLVPGAHSRRRINAQLAERTGRHANRQARPLIDRQSHPGAGELLDSHRPSKPVRGQRFQTIGRTRMGREKARVVPQRRCAGTQVFGKARGRVAGQCQQYLGHGIGALPDRCQYSGIGGAMRPVFCAGSREGRDHAMRDQIEKVGKRERT